jgi:general secretion pathway protein J
MSRARDGPRRSKCSVAQPMPLAPRSRGDDATTALSAGFTLIEILVALAIAALIALLGYRALAALSQSETRLTAEAARWRTLDLFFARLEGDLRQAMPRPARLGDARAPAWIGTSDAFGNSALEFSRAGPEFALEAGSAGQRLAYRFNNGTIEVLYWASYDRPREAQPAAYPLVTDVARFRLSYLAASGAWVPAWPLAREAALPRAVKVELTLASGEVIERWLALR